MNLLYVTAINIFTINSILYLRTRVSSIFCEWRKGACMEACIPGTNTVHPTLVISSLANLIVPFSLPTTVLLPLDGAVSSLAAGIIVPRFNTAPCGAEISPERFRSRRLRLRRRSIEKRGSWMSSISDSRVESRAWEMVRGR